MFIVFRKQLTTVLKNKYFKCASQVTNVSINSFNNPKLLTEFRSKPGICFKMVFDYPEARRDESQVEPLHGVKVPDVYRWLEEPDSEETKNFVQKQNEISMSFINSCQYKTDINERLTELWNYPKYGCPMFVQNKYFFSKNTGLQNQSVLYKQETLDSEPEVFLDLNQLNPEGTTSLSVASFSEDGKWFAYGLSDAGSDWVQIKVKNVDTGIDCDEIIEKCKFTSVSWTHDNLGFFYSCYPDHVSKNDGTETKSNENQKVFYHRINTPQSEDVLTIEFPDHPKWRSNAEVSDCGKYLFVSVKESCRYNLLYYCDLDTEMKPISGILQLTPLFADKFEADYDYITNDGNKITMKTNKGAKNFRIVRFDLKNPSEDKWTTVLKEHEKDVLNYCQCVSGNILAVVYIRDVVDFLEFRKLEDGSLIKKLDIPIGTVASFRGERKYSELFFTVTSLLTPFNIYHMDLYKSYDHKLIRQGELNNFDPSDFTAEQVFYSSADGTRVPMFIVRGKDCSLDGSNPCLLYGYGGFNVSIQPFFSTSKMLLMKNLKGIFAIANIRGGGEYGDQWHDGGRLMNKQNCFDDFIAAAEYLVSNKYTCKEKLIIEGSSNGGLLVAACSNQRPDLFACSIAHVGVMDMLRFHKFTIGHAWVSDYGNPDEEDHFKNVFQFSPLHNVPKETAVYPKTLLLTADHDDRVSPLHSLKYIAELQYRLGKKLRDVPLLIRVDVKAGHGGGKPTSKIIEELTDVYCFIIQALGLEYYK